MPGLFGGIGCTDPLVYARLRAEFSRIWGEHEVVDGRGWAVGGHAFAGRCALVSTSRYRYAVDGDYSLYDRPVNGSSPFDHDFRIDASGVRLGPNHMGNLALIDEVAQSLHLAAEWSGSFPLYFTKHDGGILFSSHLRPLARVTHASVDELGLLEFLRNGFTFAGRSIFSGIARMLPGQSLRYDAATGAIEVHETSQAWAVASYDEVMPNAVADNSWRLLGEAVRRAVPRAGPIGLMMSAGWDSRTLLAVLNATASDRIVCYSHGDTASRELQIVARLCRSRRLEHFLEPIDGQVLDLHDLQRGFDRVENVIFPHWHRAGRALREMGIPFATAGVYGEVMGGHYGSAMLLGSRRTMIAIASGLLPKRRGVQQQSTTEESAESLLRVMPFGHHWYLRHDFEQGIPSAVERMNADVEADLSRLRGRGIRPGNQLVEAFISEHRGSQYINAQLLSCRAYIDVGLPFAAQEPFRAASALPLHAKIHNSLSRRILRRHAPELLNYPLAATLVRASLPIFLQEISRLVRKAYGRGRWELYLRTRGATGLPRFGWVDFEFLKSGDLLRNLAEDLQCGFWDRRAIDQVLGTLAAVRMAEQLHPFYDQMAKIYTVDLVCR